MFKSKKIILGALIGALALSSTMIIANANNTEENPYDLPSFYNTSEYFRSNKHTNKVTVNDTTCPNYLEDDDKEAYPKYWEIRIPQIKKVINGYQVYDNLVQSSLGGFIKNISKWDDKDEVREYIKVFTETDKIRKGKEDIQ